MNSASIEYDPANGQINVIDSYFSELLQKASDFEDLTQIYFDNKQYFPKGLTGEQRRYACAVHCNNGNKIDTALIDTVVECANCNFVGFPCANCATYVLDKPEWSCT